MFAPLLVLLIVLWERCLANADASSIKNTAADIHALDVNFVEHYVHCEKVSRRLIFLVTKMREYRSSTFWYVCIFTLIRVLPFVCNFLV